MPFFVPTSKNMYRKTSLTRHTQTTATYPSPIWDYFSIPLTWTNASSLFAAESPGHSCNTIWRSLIAALIKYNTSIILNNVLCFSYEYSSSCLRTWARRKYAFAFAGPCRVFRTSSDSCTACKVTITTVTIYFSFQRKLVDRYHLCGHFLCFS